MRLRGAFEHHQPSTDALTKKRPLSGTTVKRTSTRPMREMDGESHRLSVRAKRGCHRTVTPLSQLRGAATQEASRFGDEFRPLNFAVREARAAPSSGTPPSWIGHCRDRAAGARGQVCEPLAVEGERPDDLAELAADGAGGVHRRRRPSANSSSRVSAERSRTAATRVPAPGSSFLVESERDGLLQREA
jgi:hypothetical protein